MSSLPQHPKKLECIYAEGEYNDFSLLNTYLKPAEKSGVFTLSSQAAGDSRNDYVERIHAADVVVLFMSISFINKIWDESLEKALADAHTNRKVPIKIILCRSSSWEEDTSLQEIAEVLVDKTKYASSEEAFAIAAKRLRSLDDGNGPRYASVRLVYDPKSRYERGLMNTVAEELGRRGVVAWLQDDSAMPRHTLYALYLTKDPQSEAKKYLANSDVAIIFDGSSGINHLPQLQNVRVRIDLSSTSDAPQTYIANELTNFVYRSLDITNAQALIIQLDQRSNLPSPREGIPMFPDPWQQQSAPALIFRPDRGMRSENETLFHTDWGRLLEGFQSALGLVFVRRGMGPKKILVCGEAQLGWPYLLGRSNLNKQDKRQVEIYNSDDDQVYHFDYHQSKLPKGNRGACEWVKRPTSQNTETLAIWAGKSTYIPTLQDFLKAATLSPKPDGILALRHDEGLEQREALQIIADLQDTIEHHQQFHGLKHVYFFCDLPYGVMPLLGGHFSNLLNRSITFMEYRKDLVGPIPDPSQWFVELKMSDEG